MSPMILIAGSVMWYFGIELLLAKLRARAAMPSRASFWLGLTQGLGAFALVLGAAVCFVLQK